MPWHAKEDFTVEGLRALTLADAWLTWKGILAAYPEGKKHFQAKLVCFRDIMNSHPDPMMKNIGLDEMSVLAKAFRERPSLIAVELRRTITDFVQAQQDRILHEAELYGTIIEPSNKPSVVRTNTKVMLGGVDLSRHDPAVITKAGKFVDQFATLHEKRIELQGMQVQFDTLKGMIEVRKKEIADMEQNLLTNIRSEVPPHV